MTAADVASINLHSDVYQVLQLMSSQDTAVIEELEASVQSNKIWSTADTNKC